METRCNLEQAAQDLASWEPAHPMVSRVLVIQALAALGLVIRALEIMKDISVLDRAINDRATSQVSRVTPSS